MPYPVKQLLEGKGRPICIDRSELVTKALTTMIEHDFSQLPVYSSERPNYPLWLVTYEGTLRGIRNFKADIGNLRVQDVMVKAPIAFQDNELFDILDQLRDTNAVLIMDGENNEIAGIVTSYDTTEYFRNRTEDLMRVQEVENTIKEFIKEAYINEAGEFDEPKVNAMIPQITNRIMIGGKKKDFNTLTLGEYIQILLLDETWPFFNPIFGMERDYINRLLNGIREIRNELAHFRGDLAPEQRDQLKFGAQWITRCREEYEATKQEKEKQVFVSPNKEILIVEEVGDRQDQIRDENTQVDFSIAEEGRGGSRYEALADWLQSQPGRIDQIQLTFKQIEEIIQSELPISARSYRAWWANDTVSHTQSRFWLDAGWKTSYINLREERVTFIRIREREQAYIDFFGKLLDDLRKKKSFTVKDVNPDGANWIEIARIPRNGPSYGIFAFSFSRQKRMRVELYLDLGNRPQTKAVFDQLHAQKEQFEAKLGMIEWERLETKQGSRIAIYHEGYILEPANHKELRQWAAETMVKFYNVLCEPAEDAIIEAKKR